MTHRLRPLLIAVTLLVASLPAGSPLAPAPALAATGDPGCVTEIVILQNGEAATRLNCEGNDDLTPVTDPPSTTTIYPPYCATGTRAFVTPRSYDKLGRVIARDASGKIAAGGYGWEPTSVASQLVRNAVVAQTRDQLAAAYTKARPGEPVLPNSFLWRTLAPDIVAALLQIEALPSSIGGGGGALVRRDLTDRLKALLTLTSTSKVSPYFADGSYFQPDEFGKTDSFSVTNGATILPEGLAAVGGAVWTLPVGEGATDLQLLPTTHLTSSSVPGMPSSWSTFLKARVANFWSSGGELATFEVQQPGAPSLSLRDLLSYTWVDAGVLPGTPFTSTAPVKAAVAKSFVITSGPSTKGFSSTRLPVKMMYRVERYVPVNRVVAWQKYQRVWVPPTTQKVCTTTVKGKKTCKMVTTPGYYKWSATNTYAGNRLSKWIAKDYPQPASTLTTRWEPISALVGYQIEMGPDTWAASEAAYNSGIKGSSSSLSGLLAKQQRDADSSSGTLLRKLEGDWWSVGVIPGLKNAGGTTLASVSTLMNQAVMRQLGTDTNKDKRITGAEGMTYGQSARWYIGNGAKITPGLSSTLMLPAFRAPSEILIGAAQSASPGNAGTKAIEICGNPIKKMNFGAQIGTMSFKPLSPTLLPGGVEMQRMGMVLYENNCRTNNIARATDYNTELRGAPGIKAEDTVGAACWTGWGLYRVPLPFISASSDLSAIFNYYKVKRTGICPDGTTTCNRWTTPVLDTAAVTGKPYAIVGDGALPPAYLNVVSTKSGFGGAPAAISAGQIGVTLEIGRVCRVVAGTDLVRYCSNITDVAGRLIARINRDPSGYPASIVFDRTPLSRLGDPDCRSLSRAALLTECGIGYDEKSGNYFFRVRVRTWWDGVISHSLADWPKPLGLFSNLTFSGSEATNSASFDYLRSWGSPANLGLSDRYKSSLTFAQENPPTGSPWVYGNGSAAPAPATPPAGWGAYWLCSSYASSAQAANCPVSSSSPEYRRRARPLFDASMACNPDGSLTALLNDLRKSGAVSTAAQRADCFLDIPVVSSQPGAN